MKGQAAYMVNLKETMASLRTKMEELKAISNDVNLKARVAEQQGMMRSSQVVGWLTRVEDTEKEVNEILREDEQISCNQCRAAYKLGKKATKLLNIVIELINKGGFQEVANQQPLPAPSAETEGFSEMPMENTVGIESILQRVWEHLKDDKVGIIGLYGMGGVGKTTLLKRINNELPKRGNDVFDLAVWVVASKQATVEAIQLSILGKLRMSFESWTNKPGDVKSALIYQTLKGRKYILMLDDVWERIDLLEVGIPLHNNQNNGKILFTTRSEEVCGQMEADLNIKVTCLSWEKAWALFQDKVGKTTLSSHHEISRLAEMVAKECDGLPLALITIGRAMACRKTPYEWSHALQVLRKYPSKFSGMADHVLPILKFSYDTLPRIMQDCFVYCSIFPEDYEIPNNKLVDLWIGEGLLKEYDDMLEARNHGFYIIESLKLACLLESGSTSYLKVKMHDVIRDMALWIASDYGQHNKKFVISEKMELTGAKASVDLDWNKEVQKMSMWGIMVKEPILTCLCPQLSTLVVNDTSLRGVPLGLFQFIPFVTVLDLSNNESLNWLPEEISTLTNLEYLDLSRTALKRLPSELRGLRRLRFLLMNYMEKLKEIPTEIISDLKNLWVFRMNYGPRYSEDFLRALESLEQINEISIYTNSSKMLMVFLQSLKLQSCARYVRLNCINWKDRLVLSPFDMKNLEALQILGSHLDTLSFMSVHFCNLHHVIIWHCHSLRCLNCLAYAPSLQNLWVRWCESLQVIVGLESEDGDEKYEGAVFSNLKRIRLDNLLNLTCICAKPQPFPSLERVYINRCSGLLSLPFNDIPCESSLELIKGEQKWWNSLSWRHDGLKQYFSQFFQHWTSSVIVERINGPMLVSSGDWPESESMPYHDAHRARDVECLHILRSSINIWEE